MPEAILKYVKGHCSMIEQSNECEKEYHLKLEEFRDKFARDYEEVEKKFGPIAKESRSFRDKKVGEIRKNEYNEVLKLQKKCEEILEVCIEGVEEKLN